MSATQWWVAVGGDTLGPMSADEVRRLVEQGIVTAKTMVSRDGETWHLAEREKGWGQSANVGNSTGAPNTAPKRPTTPTTPIDVWYVASHDGDQYGPITKKELDEWSVDGALTPDCQVMRGNNGSWQPATSVYPGLREPADQQEAQSTVTPVINTKSSGTNSYGAQSKSAGSNNGTATLVAVIITAVIGIVVLAVLSELFGGGGNQRHVVNIVKVVGMASCVFVYPFIKRLVTESMNNS